jgi:tetratricopeptide (TPR) repeat protein
MELYWRLFYSSFFVFFLWGIPAFSASTKTVIADGQYVMADGDTLASAEEKVLQRAQRNAVEEAGVYLESTFRDVEKESGGRSTQTSSLEIRTIAAAVTETEILESRRSFELDRPVFFVRIRATVNVSDLAEAIRRLQSDQQLAQHFHQLQQENHQLRAQLQELQQQPVGVRMLVIDPNGKSNSHQRARAMLKTALHTSKLRDKIQLSTDAATLDDRYVDPLIVRGQTYLRLVSLAFSQQAKALDYADYLDKARIDFDRAITLDAKNVWAWVGKGDVLTWLKQLDEAAAAYEQALELDSFADIARQPLIGVYTTLARRQADAKSLDLALATLQKLLNAETPESWIPYQKEAYALRSEIYLRLNQPEQAIEDLSTVIRVDPTNAAALVTRAKLYRERLQGRLAKDDLERACVLGSTPACEQLP